MSNDYNEQEQKERKAAAEDALTHGSPYLDNIGLLKYSDLCKQLRETYPTDKHGNSTASQAADAIESLRAENESLRAECGLRQIRGYNEAKQAAEADNAALRDAMHRIAQWADAYPLDIFPEPDFDKAHNVLSAAGMTLDAISASNMRYVVEGVGKIAKAALLAGEEKQP